jgi:hypothetical protein
VLAFVANDASRKTLHGIAQERILSETTVFTAEWSGYVGLDKVGFPHRRINHASKV